MLKANFIYIFHFLSMHKMRSKVPYTLFLTSNTQLVRRCPSQGLFCTNYWPNLVAICYLATQLPDGRGKHEPPSCNLKPFCSIYQSQSSHTVFPLNTPKRLLQSETLGCAMFTKMCPPYGVNCQGMSMSLSPLDISSVTLKLP